MIQTIPISTSLVPITAGDYGFAVGIAPVPGSSIPFTVYDANQNQLAVLTGVNTSYTWSISPNGAPFYPGQIVGYAAVSAGTANFNVTDLSTLPKAVSRGSSTVKLGASGAITIKSGVAFITDASAAALTLAAPIAGVDDGKQLVLIDTTGQAHTVTTPSNGINGNKHIATYGGTVADLIAFRAYQGVWYVEYSTGITLS